MILGDSSKSNKTKPHVYWIDFDVNTEWIRNMIQEADVLVTSRFHAMISGLALKIPTIVIGWGHKYMETMAYFDMKEFCINFREFPGDLNSIVKNVLSEKAVIAKKFNKYLPIILDKASVQFEYLSKVLA